MTPTGPRRARAHIVLASLLACAAALALDPAAGALGRRPAPAGPRAAAADPRVVGHTEHGVRILRGTGTDSPTAVAPAASPPTASAPATAAAATDTAGQASALELARRLVGAYGGPTALRAWLDRGERRGRQSILVPARIGLRYVERRQDGRVRVDAQNAGITVSFADGPEGGWQSYLGLVTDLSEAQEEELARARAHDESLLLDVLEGRAHAERLSEAGADILRVEGPSGGPTDFVCSPGGPDAGPAEIRFRDVSELRKEPVEQSIALGDWRELAPEREGLVGPAGARVPFAGAHSIDGALVETDSLDTVDLLASFDDSVFARPGSADLVVGPARRVVLPLEARGGHHFTRVSVNGGPPRLFLVDTGAGVTAISRALADTLGLALGDTAGLVGLSQGVPARFATLHSLGLGALTRRDVACFVLDFGELRDRLGLTVDGILGFSALNRYAVTFDFDHGALELIENAARRAPGAGGARVPIEMLGGVALVRGRVDGGEEIPFILDTGSPRTFVPSDVGRALAAGPAGSGGGRAAKGGTRTLPFVGADGRTIEAFAARAKSLSIGSARVAGPELLYLPPGLEHDPIGITLASGERGVLGADLLTRFNLTLDYPRAELVLAARRSPPRPPLTDP